jgi:hypothetical protein
MQKINQLQEYFPSDWSGLTDENHLGAIYGRNPQQASKLTSLIRHINFGMDLELFLSQFPVKYFEDDAPVRWYLQSDGRKNIPLVGASINGTAVGAASKAGIANAEFVLTFATRWFSDQEMIFGEKNEKYPIRIKSEPTPNGLNWDYRCELNSGDPDLFIPYQELIAGKRFSRGWGAVETSMSKKGISPNYTSPFSMMNEWTFIRFQDTRPGNMIKKPVAFSWVVENPKTGKKEQKTTWMEYADWQFERQFVEAKNKAIMWGTINKAADGTFKQKGLSGNVIKTGSGIIEQMNSSNVDYYSDFDIEWLTERLLDLSVGKIKTANRNVVLRTGEWGAYQFHKSMESHVSLYTPLDDTSRVSKSGNDMTYGGQFKRFVGPNGVIVNLMIESMYDDYEMNKIMHPSGKGLASSYTYDIFALGTDNEGDPNIQLCYVKGEEDIRGYEPGLRDPFSLASDQRRVMSNPTDAYTIHRACKFMVNIKDPLKTGRLIHNSLA